MDFNYFHAILAQATTVAPAPTGQMVEDPKGIMLKQVIIFACLGLMFYFVLIRPQQKKAKLQQEMLKTVKPGDKVFTSAGIVGVVLTVKEKTVTLRSADAKFELAKSAITEITERGGSTGES